MFIRKRGTKWQARVAIKGCPEQVRTFPTEAEAYAWGAQAEREIRERGYTKPDETTVRGALARYADQVTVAKKGAAKEASIIRRIAEHRIAALPLLRVEGADVARYRDDMKAGGYAPATVCRHLAVLGNLFNVARREWGFKIPNPVEAVKKPTIRNNRQRRVSADELTRICGATESPELELVVRLAIETCMRRSELVTLRWNAVDLQRRIISLADSKTGARVVPLSGRACELLSSLLRRADGRVFGLAADSITQAFARACRRANVPGLRFHDLRHEGVSRLVERGLNLMEVATVSGHKTLAMLKRYTHLQAEELARKLA